MFIATIALAAVTLVQQPSAETPKPDLAIISGRLGACSADFTVKDSDGKPVYAAIIHVRIRYSFLSLKRMDLEIGTNSDGKARVEGLPSRARRGVPGLPITAQSPTDVSAVTLLHRGPTRASSAKTAHDLVALEPTVFSQGKTGGFFNPPARNPQRKNPRNSSSMNRGRPSRS